MRQVRFAHSRRLPAIFGELFKLNGNGLVPGKAGGLLAHIGVSQQTFRHFRAL